MTPEEQKIADKKAADAAAAAANPQPKDGEGEPPVDPIKVELAKVKKKGEGKSELEKAIFTRQQIDKRIAELKGDEPEDAPDDVDDDTPVTVKMLKKIDKDKSVKTALTLAEDIEEEGERELVKHHISNTIKPSGNAAQDLKNARAIVNSVKNEMVIEEINRKQDVKKSSSAAGAPAKSVAKFEPTAEELKFMGKPWNLSKEKILAARNTAQ